MCDATAIPAEPDCSYRCRHGGEFRAFVVPPHACAALLIAKLKSAAYLGVSSGSRKVHVSFANTTSSDRGGEPRQARVCETLQKEACRIHREGATVVVWRCFGAALTGGMSLEDAHWIAYRELGAAGLQAAYSRVARGAVDRYNGRITLEPGASLCEPRSDYTVDELVGADNGALETSDEQACWSGLRPMVPDMMPIPCAYYDCDFLPQAEADRLLGGLVGEHSEVVWAIGGQAAKRYTAVYCDDGLGEYAGGLGYANDVMRPWTPILRELRDRVVAWHKQKTGRDVAFNVVRRAVTF